MLLEVSPEVLAEVSSEVCRVKRRLCVFTGHSRSLYPPFELLLSVQVIVMAIEGY
ncbi:hypothetical protein [Paraburkholderia bannensis]|uniref:hypothetical protein n=1 Tax=Paraburkholderia bannensis TaxID=765414 RepID=UPI002AAFFEE4|nr:hypothetical protein [Paraburkholderia bannensis]